MSQINFSIVIPTWNRSELVDSLLRTLSEDRDNYRLGETEVLIVDSSEGDEQKAIEKSCKKYKARYIRSNESVRKKRNKGIDLAKNEHVLFLDSDVEVKPGLLEEHAQVYLKGEEGDKLGGAFGLTEFVGPKTFWWKILELTSFVDSFSFAKRYPYVSWTIGNNVSFKRDVLLEIGKFEENFPFKLGGDDLDMTYRVTKAGYLIKSIPEAVTYHSRKTWNHWKAVNDRSKRWGSMEYHILKRHPELVHRRLPMTGDIVLFMALFFCAAALIRRSYMPLVFFGIWCVILYVFMYGFYVKNNGYVNPFYWSAAMALQGKYRFHRLMTSIKNGDLSLAFKGQFFGIEHIKSDYRQNVQKVNLYYISIVLIVLIICLYAFVKRG